MDHHTRLHTRRPGGLTLRYRLLPGSTVRYRTQLDLYMEVHRGPDAPPSVVDAQIYADFDLETLRVQETLALVRLHIHRTDLWVKPASTVAEEQVVSPLAGLPPAFLLDDLGSSVPVIDLEGSAVAPPEDGNAARFALKAMLPPLLEDPIHVGDRWEVELAPGTTWATAPVIVHGELGRVKPGSSGLVEPIVLHRCSYDWVDPNSKATRGLEITGTTRHESQSHLHPRQGFPTLTESEIQVDSTLRGADGSERIVETRLRLRAERTL